MQETGPSSSGKVSIKAVHILALASDNVAHELPMISEMLQSLSSSGHFLYSVGPIREGGTNMRVTSSGVNIVRPSSCSCR